MSFKDPSRRTFLRAAGATVALPWMESLALASEASPPVRMIFLFQPNGVLPSAWTPEQEGADWKPTPTLEPLATFRDRTLVLTGLRNKNSLTGEGHYVCGKCYRAEVTARPSLFRFTVFYDSDPSPAFAAGTGGRRMCSLQHSRADCLG